MSFHLNRFHLVVGTYPKELLPQITPIFLQQDLQVSEQDWTILRVAEAELDAGGNKAGGIAEVMANATMDPDLDGMVLGDEESDDVGKLQLPALAGSNTAESTKNRAAQKVAPRGHQIRRRIPNRRFFHHAHNLPHPIIVGSLHIKDVIIRHLRRLHLHRQQQRTTMLLAHLNHLTHGGGGLNDPIGKHDRGIVPVGI